MRRSSIQLSVVFLLAALGIVAGLLVGCNGMTPDTWKVELYDGQGTVVRSWTASNFNPCTSTAYFKDEEGSDVWISGTYTARRLYKR
jgi:hypothetical protein